MKKIVTTLAVCLEAIAALAQTQTEYTLTIGDYNKNGAVEIADITYLVNAKDQMNRSPWILTDNTGSLVVNGQLCEQYVYGDMDMDGDIDADDVQALAQVVLGRKNAPWLKRTFAPKQSGYANVNDYGPLKSYINKVSHPDFKSAAAVNVQDFNSKGSLYELTKENFDEVVADNAMKMSSVVSSNGAMNFNTVKQFVNNATQAGLNVYGHVLAWHSQQPNAWLGGLIADRKRPVVGTTVYLVDRDFSTSNQLIGGWGNSSSQAIEDGVMVLTNPTVGQYSYSAQAAIDFPEALEVGRTYTLKLKARSTSVGQLLVGFQNPDGYVGCGDFAPISLSRDWKEYSFDCECTGANAKRFIFSYGLIAGDIMIDDLQLYTVVADQSVQTVREVVADRDFSTPRQMLGGWGGSSTRRIVDGVMVLTNPEATEKPWNVQAAIDFATPLRNGNTYTLQMKVRADAEGSLSFGLQKKDGYAGRGEFGSINLTTDWQDIELTTKVTGEDADRFLMSYGNIEGNIYIDDLLLYTTVEIEADSPMATDPNISYFINRDFSTRDQLIGGWGNSSTRSIEDGMLVLDNPTAAGYWEAQASIDFTEAFTVGQTYTLSMKVRADGEGQLRIGFQNPDGYASCGDFSLVTLTQEWQTVKLTCTVSKENALRFIFSFGDVEGHIYIDDLRLYIDPYVLTQAEKKAILTDAMGLWIDGMMAATECKVKDWDMINEAVSGGGDVNGYYDLQHFEGFQAGTWDVGGANFFWQDYLGSEQYGVIVERLARKAFADHGGNPADLKLFVNDYNLESDWDNNKKLRSMIYWVNVWEQGGAKIDGLGTQMHINYSRNKATQASKQAHITQMFQLMAATGKLVRISELDMGLTDENNIKVTIDQVTDADRVAMAEYYEWIIQQYLTIIPKAQQYGICQWSLTDSPAQSGWRANEPIGIYDRQYGRKPSYAGWAEGLKATWR